MLVQLRRKPSRHEAATVAGLELDSWGELAEIGGSRAFRRRLMELGLVPGTPVCVRNVAPLGDPLELEVRGARLSIRRDEARQLRVTK